MSDSCVIVPIPKAFQIPLAVSPLGYRVLTGEGPLRTGDVIRAVGGHALVGKQAPKRWRQHWRDGAELLVVPAHEPLWGKPEKKKHLKHLQQFSKLDEPRVPSTPSTCASTPMQTSIDACGNMISKLDLDGGSLAWNSWWSCQQNEEAYDSLEVEPEMLSPKMLAAAMLLSVPQLEERWPEDFVTSVQVSHTLDTESWWTDELVAAVELSHILDIIREDHLNADAEPFTPAFRFNTRAPVFFPRILRRSWD